MTPDEPPVDGTPGDILSPDEMKPDSCNIIDSESYVKESLTYSSIEYKVKKDFISNIFTYIIDLGIDIDTDIVNLIFTKYGLIIAGFIQEHPVFAAPTIYHSQKLHRQVVDPYLHKFRKLGILKKHDKLTLSFPPAKPKLQGRRPPVWYLAHLEIKDAMDPRVKAAVQDYWVSGAFDNNGAVKKYLSTRDLQNTLCKEYIYKYTEKGRFDKVQAPKRPEVLKRLQADPRSQELAPTVLYGLAKTISDELYSIRRGSHD